MGRAVPARQFFSLPRARGAAPHTRFTGSTSSVCVMSAGHANLSRIRASSPMTRLTLGVKYHSCHRYWPFIFSIGAGVGPRSSSLLQNASPTWRAHCAEKNCSFSGFGPRKR